MSFGRAKSNGEDQLCKWNDKMRMITFVFVSFRFFCCLWVKLSWMPQCCHRHRCRCRRCRYKPFIYQRSAASSHTVCTASEESVFGVVGASQMLSPISGRQSPVQPRWFSVHRTCVRVAEHQRKLCYVPMMMFLVDRRRHRRCHPPTTKS